MTTARYCGSNRDRQGVGLPGHCERCAEMGHVRAHPDLGCTDVGCYAHHDEDPGGDSGVDAAPRCTRCTGLTARWCPIHGACRCVVLDVYDHERCPLHSSTSSHAEVDQEALDAEVIRTAFVYIFAWHQKAFDDLRQALIASGRYRKTLSTEGNTT